MFEKLGSTIAKYLYETLKRVCKMQVNSKIQQTDCDSIYQQQIFQQTETTKLF